MTDWRTQYELAAENEAARFASATDEQLLAAIREGKTGEYFTLWRLLGTRRATPKICWALYDVLLSDREYLDRYHCANALLQLLDCDEFTAVQLSAAWPDLPTNLVKLRGIIESAMGPPAL